MATSSLIDFTDGTRPARSVLRAGCYNDNDPQPITYVELDLAANAPRARIDLVYSILGREGWAPEKGDGSAVAPVPKEASVDLFTDKLLQTRISGKFPGGARVAEQPLETLFLEGHPQAFSRCHQPSVTLGTLRATRGNREMRFYSRNRKERDF
jgi:hypothetical protein